MRAEEVLVFMGTEGKELFYSYARNILIWMCVTIKESALRRNYAYVYTHTYSYTSSITSVYSFI